MPYGGAMGSYLVTDPTADHTGWALWVQLMHFSKAPSSEGYDSLSWKS